ncbi:hypothetical protein H0H92_000530 [Tricholoma furcatifolium]|nr:hypothetical protein H0H92_000530 [Tricholoma furcatifolium]
MSDNGEQQSSTHATRNPAKKIIPPRENNVKKTRAEQATANIGQALKKENKAALQKELDDFAEEREQRAVDLAKKYNVKVPYMRARLSNSLLCKLPRRPSKWNALVSRRGQELNAGQNAGARYSLAEIQDIVRDEIEQGLHNDVDDDELLHELKEKRKVSTQGARSSNRAATLDYNATLFKVRDELADMYQRTGALGFAFFTRGHVLDNVIPGYVESQDSLKFITDVLNTTPAEIARKFEQWACSKDRGASYDTTVSMRTEALTMINNGLQKIVAKGNISMSYENYETAIVERFSVVLRGWPEGLKFQSPAKI